MAGIRPIIVSLAMVILFAICFFMFMIEFVSLNNPDETISDDPFVNSSLENLRNSADYLGEVGTNAKNTLSQDEPSAVYVFLILKSAFTIPFSFIPFLISGISVIGTIIFTTLFGSGSSPFYVIFGLVNSILLITIVIVIIKFVRGGESER